MIRLGVDAQFARVKPRAGLFMQHRAMFAEMQRRGDIDLALFLNAWTTPPGQSDDIRRDVSEAFDGLRVRVTAMPSRLRRLRLRFSPLGRIDAMYHVFGGTFDAVPGAANVFLVPDLIPLFIDYGAELTSLATRYYEKAAAHADLILVYSEHTRTQVMERLGVAPGRVVVTPLAASSAFHPSQPGEDCWTYLRSLGITSPYVLAVGTLESRKNLVLLVQAFARLKRHHPELPHRLVLCGGNWHGHELVLESIHQEGVSGDVLVLGYAERVDVLYRGAAAFAFPSKFEGFGLPPLEAMASGIPVVAANATSVPEVVGDAGLLFDPDSVDDLEHALSRVLLDSGTAAALASAGLKRAAQFTWQRTTELTVAAIEQAIGARSGC